MTLYSRLAAYYPCDDTHGRSLSEDIVGTNNGTAGVASSATGKVRQGMFFLSSGSQFRSVPDDSAIKQLKGVCCWVKFTTLAADMSLVSKGSDGTDANTSIKLWYDHSDTDLAFTVGDTGGESTTIRTDGLTLAIDTWYHIRAYNDGNRMGIAVNGTLYASGAARIPLAEAGLLYLGRDFGGNYLDGVLDEVALFSTAPTIADGAALYNGGSGASLPIPDTLPGPLGRAGVGSRWLPPSFAESDDAVSYMAHGKLPVQRFDGTLSEAGVEAPDQKVTVKSSGSGTMTGRRYAYVRFLDSDRRVSSMSPLSDVHDTFGDSVGAITGATNASPIVITAASHGLATGQTVRVTGQLGNTAANGTWTVKSLTANTFSLDGSVGNGDWTSSAPPSMQVNVKQEGSAGVSQVQTLSYSNTPTAGSFVLKFKGEPTTAIAYNASAATIQTALNSLTSIDEDGVLCAGGSLDSADVTITFQNTMANVDHPILEVDFTGAPSTLSATVTQTGTSGVNEVQTISLIMIPTGGTFTLTYSGQTTSAIAYNASAATVDAALEALSNIGAGDVTCTGGDLPDVNVAVEFTGTLAQTNVAEMTINPASLTGTSITVGVSTTTGGVTAGTAWDVSTAGYASKSFDVSGETDRPRTIAFKGDGTKLYVNDKGTSGHGGEQAGVFQYSLSTAWDISTASYDSKSLSLIAHTFGINFSSDGTKAYFFQNVPAAGRIYEYDLSTAWDISTASTNGNIYAFQNASFGYVDFAFKSDGTKLYGLNINEQRVYQHSLSTAWDISTASYDSVTMSFADAVSATRGFAFKDDGTKVYIGDTNEDIIFQYSLSTAWDISTGTYESKSLDVGSELYSVSGVALNDDGTKLYAVSESDEEIFQYSLDQPGSSETQQVSITGSPSEGSFTLTYDGQTTSHLDYNASAANVDSALEALSNIGTGDVTCTGGPLPGTDVDVEFTGALADTDVAEMTATASSAPSVAISTPTAGAAGTPYSISGAAYDSVTYDFTSDIGNGVLRDVAFADSGNKIWVLFTGVGSGFKIRQFSAAAPYSMSSPSYDSVEFHADSTAYDHYHAFQVINTSQILFMNANDLTLDLWEMTQDEDLSTLAYLNQGSFGGEVSGPTAFYSSVAGDMIYVMGHSVDSPHPDRIAQYNATSGYAASMSYSTYDYDASAEDSDVSGIRFNDDGTKMFLLGRQNDAVKEYALSTAYRISTASYSSISFSVAGQATYPAGLVFKPDGRKFWICMASSDEAWQYSSLSGGTNESQRITVSGSPTQGTFTLTYDGQETAAIDYDATAAEVDTALEALSNIDAGEVTCTGGPLPGSVVDVEFTGDLAATDVSEMTADGDLLRAKIVTTTGGTKTTNEVVTLATDVPPGTGTFTLTFGGITTGSLNWNATATEVQAELEGLSSIGAGNVSCTGGPINVAGVVVNFQGTLSTQDVGAVTASSSMTQTSPVMGTEITTDGLGGTNEIQTITAEGATGGTFTLSSDADVTPTLSFDATASEVEQELDALSDVGNGNVQVTGGPLDAASFEVEFIGTLGSTDVSTLGKGTGSLLNGGYASGASKITYSNVALPSSTNVTRRQILRSKPGSVNLLYIDVDEEDVVSTEFSSTNTDDDLLAADAIVLLDANGVDTNLSRHGVPPNWKRSIASFSNRLFFGVDYVERPVVTVSGDTATGVGTDWPNVFDDRMLYEDSGKALAAFDANNQTAALSESTATDQTAETATVRKEQPDSQRVYHSWVNAIDSFPESVHPGQTFQISRDTLDGEMTGQFSFGGRFYTAFEHSLYEYAFNNDPAAAPNGDGRMQKASPRGLINQQCVTFSDDFAYLLDRDGCYSFDGNSVTPLSEVIKPIFTGRGERRINWARQQWFFSEYFPQQRTVRLFVVLDGGPYPKHALCHNVDQGYWWVEQYPFPITSSTRGSVNGKTEIFLGSTGRRIFTLSGSLEGAISSTSTLQGTATSAGCLTLSDSSATYGSELVNVPLRIVDGTGYGQERIVVSVSGTTLTVDQPWNKVPSTDSVYQLGGIHWTMKTGKLRFTQNNTQEKRRVEVLYEPLTRAQQLSYRLFLDWSDVAVEAEVTFDGTDTDGVAATAGSDRFEVDLTSRGHAELDFDGIRQEGSSGGDKFVSVELSGTTNKEEQRLHGIAVSGAE